MTEAIAEQLPFKVKTETSDRGTEFKVPLKQLATYYCDPQTPQQRGTVENTIGLIRQYIKRDTDLTKSKGLLKNIEKKLNDRPRKTLYFKTPYEIVTGRKVALAS